jgi:integrase
MRWGEIDADGAWWTLPASRAKNKRHRMFLCPSVSAALDSLPHASEYVFHFGRGRRPLPPDEKGRAIATNRWFPALCARAAIEECVFHD